uniref:Uncharacterized protein n=1 Tax=Vitrella brassicaformis TaxID=1169539 RepID=A0A7S1JRY6_9ALVE
MGAGLSVGAVLEWHLLTAQSAAGATRRCGWMAAPMCRMQTSSNERTQAVCVVGALFQRVFVLSVCLAGCCVVCLRVAAAVYIMRTGADIEACSDVTAPTQTDHPNTTSGAVFSRVMGRPG